MLLLGVRNQPLLVDAVNPRIMPGHARNMICPIMRAHIIGDSEAYPEFKGMHRIIARMIA